MRGQPDLPGALVISLDFELHWGVRHRFGTDNPYSKNLLGARVVIPRLLELFQEFELAATWATVGFLFASSRQDLYRVSPDRRPRYTDVSLSPYGEATGSDEIEDPLHFAPSLIEEIHRTPRQEIASHTFSHYFCTAEGQTSETFRADIEAAREIAEERGIHLRSIVFPRNRRQPAYDDVLIENGISAYRGNPLSWTWRVDESGAGREAARRAGRLFDTYLNLSGFNTTPWSHVLQPNGLSDVRASLLLRPCSPHTRALESIRFHRIRRCIRFAARNREILHLWWHPHNFGLHIEQNLAFLKGVLAEFDRCRKQYGMRSFSMAEVDDLVRSVPTVAVAQSI